MPSNASKAVSFKTARDFRAWLEKHHDTTPELMLRLFKVHASDRGIGYREALDAALCYGWIDGVRRSLDADSFTQRFTPRKAKSTWSSVNIKRVKELEAEGLMRPPGRAAFEQRDATRRAPYSLESPSRELDTAMERQFRANQRAWEYFQAQPPYYRRLSIFWVTEAKKEETRQRRLDALIRHSAKREPLPAFIRSK